MGFFSKLFGDNSRDKSRDDEFVNLCAKGSADEVRQALSSWGSLEAKGENEGVTPLMSACMNPDSNVVKLIIEELEKSSNTRAVNEVDKNKSTPLHSAGHFSTNPEVVKMLVAAGGMINALDHLGSTPLMCAVSAISLQILGKDNTAVIKALAEAVIKSGNNIDFKDRNGDTALNKAALFNINPEVVHILLNAGADIESKNSFGFTPLMSSLDNPNPEVMKALVKAGANMSVYDSSGMPLLANCVMCIQGDLMHSTPAHLRALIELGADVDTRAKTDKGQTALMLAVLFTLQPEVIEILAGSTKHINMKSFDGLSAYSLALGIDNPASAALANKNVRLNLENNKAAISILEAHGAKISFPELCSCASAERVKKAIDSGADINAKNSEGITPLIASIKDNPDKGVASALLKAGVNVNVADSENVTALMAAIACNLDTSLIIEILAAVDNLNAQDIRGYTAFDVAIELERYDVASLIETLGGRANLYRR